MATTHRVKPGRLGDWIQRVMLPDLRKGAMQAVEEAKPALLAEVVATAQREARKRDLVHQREYVEGFIVTPDAVVNDTPYAGVIELGRTPGAKEPPDAPIRQWVIDKINPPADELDAVVRRVRYKIKVNPMPPQFILRDAPHAPIVKVKYRAAFRKAILSWGKSRGVHRSP